MPPVQVLVMQRILVHHRHLTAAIIHQTQLGNNISLVDDTQIILKYLRSDKYGILIGLSFRIETTLEKQLKEERLKELDTSYYGENTCTPPKNGSFYFQFLQ